MKPSIVTSNLTTAKAKLKHSQWERQTWLGRAKRPGESRPLQTASNKSSCSRSNARILLLPWFRLQCLQMLFRYNDVASLQGPGSQAPNSIRPGMNEALFARMNAIVILPLLAMVMLLFI